MPCAPQGSKRDFSAFSSHHSLGIPGRNPRLPFPVSSTALWAPGRWLCHHCPGPVSPYRGDIPTSAEPHSLAAVPTHSPGSEQCPVIQDFHGKPQSFPLERRCSLQKLHHIPNSRLPSLPSAPCSCRPHPTPQFLISPHHSTPKSISLMSPPHPDPAHAPSSFPSPSKSNNQPITPSSRAAFFLEEFFFHDICVKQQGWFKNRFPLITSTAQSCSFVSPPSLHPSLALVSP